MSGLSQDCDGVTSVAGEDEAVGCLAGADEAASRTPPEATLPRRGRVRRLDRPWLSAGWGVRLPSARGDHVTLDSIRRDTQRSFDS
jgi:hypothetical protein